MLKELGEFGVSIPRVRRADSSRVDAAGPGDYEKAVMSTSLSQLRLSPPAR